MMESKNIRISSIEECYQVLGKYSGDMLPSFIGELVYTAPTINQLNEILNG